MKNSRDAGTAFHKTAMRNGKRMKEQAWERGEHFCPTCGARMWFPGHENKRKATREEPNARYDQKMRMVTLDHYIPRSAGGTNEMHNLRLICQQCNSDKSVKDAEIASLSPE